MSEKPSIMAIVKIICMILLALACAALTVSGQIDHLGAVIPFAPWIGATALAISALMLLFGNRFAPWETIQPQNVLVASTLSLAIMHLVLPTEIAHLWLWSFWPFLLLIPFLAAISGNAQGWLIAAAGIVLVEAAAEISGGTIACAGDILALYPFASALFAVGIPLYFAGRFIMPQEGAPPNHTREKPAPTPVTPSLPPGAEETSDGSTWMQQSAQYLQTMALPRDQLALGAQAKTAQDVEGILASVVYFMKRNFTSYSSLGFIYNARQNALVLNSYQSKSFHIQKDIAIPLGAGLVGKAGAERQSFLSGDITNYSDHLHYYSTSEDINTVLAVPILSEEKELLGVLVIDSKDKRAFTDDHKEVLRRFSNLAAALIINARMRVYQQKVARNFQIFYETSHQFTTALKTDDVFNILIQTISQMSHFSRMLIISCNSETGTAQVTRAAGNSPEIQPGFVFPLGAGMASVPYQKHTTLTIPDLSAYAGKYFRFVQGEPPRPLLGSFLSVPLLDDTGVCLGLFVVESDRIGAFDPELVQIIGTIVENATVAINRAMLYHKMELLATTDGLTGLPNHRTFQDNLSLEIERCKRYNRPFSLLILDIDHFKSFNDTYGHQVGDLVLKEISNCIRQSIRLNDIPARYGGEEFAVILPECTDGYVPISAERIRSNVEAMRIPLDGKQLQVTVSIGAASCPPHGIDKAQLISCADTAMYHSKETGRNRATIWVPGMVQKAGKGH